MSTKVGARVALICLSTLVSLCVPSCIAVPAYTSHEHRFVGEIVPNGNDRLPEAMELRTEAQGVYGGVDGDLVHVGPDGRFEFIVRENYCEPAWIFPPLDLLHAVTWRIPIDWIPILGPLLTGLRTYPLKHIVLRIRRGDRVLANIAVDPRVVRESRYRVRYEVGRIQGP